MLNNIPPCHRILGFILLLLSFIANIPVLFHYTNIYITLILGTGLIFFLIFTYYAYVFLYINHYTDQKHENISEEYVKMIQCKKNENIRFIIFSLYYIILISTWIFPSFFPAQYKEISTWQQTMSSYNFTITSFVIMYIYEHKNMNKYLSLKNVNVYNRNYVLMPETESLYSVHDI
jgi:hypothetical protein